MLEYDFTFDPSKCEECGGKCCTGESGYVFVTPYDIEEISKFLNMDFNEFSVKFVRKVGYKYSLTEKIQKDGKGHACVFFDEETRKCQIYSRRPKQCVSFPFWECYKDDFEPLLKECIGVCKK
ncbi:MULTISPECIES: YkgJ family cysteine cluster protein [Helicobacter]|uniref:YkgJ family cysteine cluster protein n=1 Tax=Helicobacter ibis TaxID=2962633 RepID=A0ABT4VDB4_9HELI|nr:MULTISPECIES: YkgJ family cysteine cluster protein [Helicobacter]MDA3967241.1 YkgJ family cysteine cluster protein [Helicobacter sp. WB40]MDA3968691.1 YkgJ family cysteine cluster protein [Helicobacter ibis]